MLELRFLVMAVGVLAFSSLTWADETAPAMTEHPDEKPPIVAELEAATHDLLLPSETDAPFRAFFWRVETGESLTGERAAQLAEIAVATPVEERTLDEVLGELAVEEAWMDEADKAQAQRFAALKKVLETKLSKLKIYVFGERRKDIVLVGEVESGGQRSYAGLITFVVET